MDVTVMAVSPSPLRFSRISAASIEWGGVQNVASFRWHGFVVACGEEAVRSGQAQEEPGEGVVKEW